MNIAALYRHGTDAGLEPLPELASLSHSVAGHTMGEKLTGYVKTKFSQEQQQALAEARADGWKIRVIGAYSGHEAIWLDALGEDYPRPDYPGVRLLMRRTQPGPKKFNKRRPYFLITQDRFSDELVLNVVTFPSREYTQQVAGLVHAAFKYDLIAAADAAAGVPKIEVVVFPELEQAVGEWTGLKDALRRVPKHVLENGIVLFGYIEEIAALLKSRTDFTRVDLPDCAACSIDRVFEIEAHSHKTEGFHLLTFGFHHTYWGSASAKLLEEFLAAGVKHTIYFAKLGALIFFGPDPETALDASTGITGGLAAPGGPFYCIRFEAGSLKYRLSSAISPPKLFARNTYAAVGRSIVPTEAAHISVPSVIGETRALEKIYRHINPATVDNEISFMADAVSRWASSVTFDCVHYVTDFVTTAHSQHHDTAGGLDQDNRARKVEQLKVAANFLLEAIESAKKGVAVTKGPPRATTNQPLRSVASTRDYLSIFGRAPDDFPQWMHPSPEYQRLATDAVARQAILACAVALRPGGDAPDLLTDVLGRECRNLDVSGPPGGGKSMVANALYHELLDRFRRRQSPIRPLLLELKKLERRAIEMSDGGSQRPKIDQRKFLQSELAQAGDMLIAEAAMGPLAIIVNGVDSSSPLFALLEASLNSWRKSAGRTNCKLIAFWRKSEWIMGGVHDPQEHPGEYRVSIDSAGLAQPAQAPLLAAICRIYQRSREQFSAALDKAIHSTGRKSPTLRVIVHFLEGKAQGNYFPDITRYRLGANGQSGAEYLEAARTAYAVVVDRNPGKNAALSWARRLVTGSDEITAYFAANFIYRQILSFAESNRLANVGEELKQMDRVFPHSINHQLKQIVNKTAEEEFKAANVIKALWGKLSKSFGLRDFMHFKSVLMYICGRFTTEPAKNIGRALLREALEGLPASDLSGGALSLHRTAHISLIFLGEDGAEYFRYLRRQPQYDAINRGFHMTYYQDQDYWSDPRMDLPDRGGRFIKTYSQLQQLQQLQLLSGRPEAVHAVTAYTVISLIVNRYRKGKLEETLSQAEALQVLHTLDAAKDLPLVVRAYARWAHHYLSTGVSVVMQAIIGLKREARAGWNFYGKNRSTRDAESVADHTLSAILLARTFLPEAATDLDEVDRRLGSYAKAAVIRMIEVHDLAEGLLGDKVHPQRHPEDDEEELGVLIGISALAAADGVPVPVYACSAIEDELAEFQAAETLNARLACDFDKMENLLQLTVYRVDQNASIPDAAEFERDVRNRLTTRTAQRIWDAISKELKDKELGMLTNSAQQPSQRRRAGRAR